MDSHPKFVLVEWIDRGKKPSAPLINVVPYTWVSTAKRSRKECLVACYPPKPYTNIDNLVSWCKAPNPLWKTWKIIIRGGSSN